MIRDEFEYTASSGLEYFVQVSGYLSKEEGTYHNTITEIMVSDSLGNEIDEDHQDYEEIYEYSLDREYDHEEEGRDFSGDDDYIDSFLKE